MHTAQYLILLKSAVVSFSGIVILPAVLVLIPVTGMTEPPFSEISEVRLQWSSLAREEGLKWRLCFRQPVQIVSSSAQANVDPWEVVKQGTESWVYETTTSGSDGSAIFQVSTGLNWDVSCNSLYYQGRKYHLAINKSAGNGNIISGTLPEGAAAQISVCEGKQNAVACSYQVFVPGIVNDQYYQESVSDKRVQDIKSNSGTLEWFVLMGVTTLIVAHILGCICVVKHSETLINWN